MKKKATWLAEDRKAKQKNNGPFREEVSTALLQDHTLLKSYIISAYIFHNFTGKLISLILKQLKWAGTVIAVSVLQTRLDTISFALQESVKLYYFL